MVSIYYTVTCCAFVSFHSNEKTTQRVFFFFFFKLKKELRTDKRLTKLKLKYVFTDIINYLRSNLSFSITLSEGIFSCNMTTHHSFKCKEFREFCHSWKKEKKKKKKEFTKLKSIFIQPSLELMQFITHDNCRASLKTSQVIVP